MFGDAVGAAVVAAVVVAMAARAVAADEARVTRRGLDRGATSIVASFSSAASASASSALRLTLRPRETVGAAAVVDGPAFAGDAAAADESGTHGAGVGLAVAAPVTTRGAAAAAGLATVAGAPGRAMLTGASSVDWRSTAVGNEAGCAGGPPRTG